MAILQHYAHCVAVLIVLRHELTVCVRVPVSTLIVLVGCEERIIRPVKIRSNHVNGQSENRLSQIKLLTGHKAAACVMRVYCRPCSILPAYMYVLLHTYSVSEKQPIPITFRH